MLTSVHLSNFAIATELELGIKQGMTAITGETGAGKSIMVDALELLSGKRADSSFIKEGKSSSTITAVFDISTHQEAQHWLSEHGYSTEGQCILRRQLQVAGSSKAFINGSPATVNELKEVSALLLDICGQHAHINLLNESKQLEQLDKALDKPHLVKDIGKAFHAYKSAESNLASLIEKKQADSDRLQLLKYQISELEGLELQSGEVHELETEQSELENHEHITMSLGNALSALSSDSEQSVMAGLQKALKQVENSQSNSNLAQEAVEMINTAIINVDETIGNLSSILNSATYDSQRLEDINTRLTELYRASKKHLVSPDKLVEHLSELQKEVENYNSIDDQIQEAETVLTQTKQAYESLAIELSSERRKAAERLSESVNIHLKTLSLEKAKFDILVSDSPMSSKGSNSVSYQFAANVGQQMKPLKLVASGGEMSRVSLALQISMAQFSRLPCLVFDEVDEGIGGRTSVSVGRLLRNLGEHNQVIVITHQAQVAALSNNHIVVSKDHGETETVSSANELSAEERIEEVARMIGGEVITDTTREHAKELMAA